MLKTICTDGYVQIFIATALPPYDVQDVDREPIFPEYASTRQSEMLL